MKPERPGRSIYLDEILGLYIRIPETPARPTTRDRQIAARLHRDGVSAILVRTALLTGFARRQAGGLDEPIRSLAYFLPVVEELTAILDYDHLETYGRHLERRLSGKLTPTIERPSAKPERITQLCLPFPDLTL